MTAQAFLQRTNVVLVPKVQGPSAFSGFFSSCTIPAIPVGSIAPCLRTYVDTNDQLPAPVDDIPQQITECPWPFLAALVTVRVRIS
jgi:hypothetical protein